MGAGVVERGEINGDILEHEWPILALLPGLADDETERGDLRGEYGDGGRYLKEEVYPCETEMVGSSKDELDQKDTVESESDACEEDLYWKRAGKDWAIGKIRVGGVTAVVGSVSERNKA